MGLQIGVLPLQRFDPCSRSSGLFALRHRWDVELAKSTSCQFPASLDLQTIFGRVDCSQATNVGRKGLNFVLSPRTMNFKETFPQVMGDNGRCIRRVGAFQHWSLQILRSGPHQCYCWTTLDFARLVRYLCSLCTFILCLCSASANTPSSTDVYPPGLSCKSRYHHD